MATKGKTGTTMTNWADALAARAQKAKKAEASVATGGFISLKSGVMSYNGNPVPSNKMNVVILDAILENHMYEGKFDPNNASSPVCFAFGRDEDEMAPHANVGEPQNETCSGCPMNEWGSDQDGGKGKACKNIRRLSMVPADSAESAEAVGEAEIAFLKVPVTSVKSWAGYVNQLSAVNKPPLAYITEISVTPDAKSQFKVNFRAVEAIEDGEVIGALLNKADASEDALMMPYAANEAAPFKPGKAPARKPAAKATAPRPSVVKAAAPVKTTTPARRKF
jgi:hypothetical protein